MEPTFVLVGTVTVVLALIAKFYYGVSPGDAAYYVYAHTFIGQMMHDTALSKHKNTIHSKPSMHDCGSFIVRTVAYLEDNYAYIIVDKETGRTAVVDPGDAERVFEHLREVQAQWDRSHEVESGFLDDSQRGKQSGAKNTLMTEVKARPELTTALITHYHADHAGGNKVLHKKSPDLRIVGSPKEPIPFVNALATEGSKFWLGRTEINVIAAPCHTKGHIMYHVHGPTAKSGGIVPSDSIPEASASTGSAARAYAGSGALFSGDTLFVGSVGKFFEGTAEQMYNILYHTLRGIPADTPIFGGHEYAVGNLKFALWVDPANKTVEEKLSWAMKRRADGLCTVPSLLSEERQYNPFLRVHINSVKLAISAACKDSRGADMPEIPALAALRTLKDKNAHESGAGKAAAETPAVKKPLFSGSIGGEDALP